MDSSVPKSSRKFRCFNPGPDGRPLKAFTLYPVPTRSIAAQVEDAAARVGARSVFCANDAGDARNAQGSEDPAGDDLKIPEQFEEGARSDPTG
jgi:hypothetical protein